MSGALFTSVGWGNFGLLLNDSPQHVEERREKLRVSLSLKSLVFMNQTHSNVALIVDGSSSSVDADAIVTTQKGIGLAVLVGDCLPILLRSSHGVAAIHAGRAGMVTGVVPAAVHALRGLGNSKIKAIIGPSICSECYEVSPEMYAQVSSLIPASATNLDAHCLDLQSGVASQLTSEGIEVLNMGICTKEASEFYSHRRSLAAGLEQGRQVGIIYL